MRRTGTGPPEFTRLAWTRGPRYTLADWAPGRVATRSRQPRAGTAAIGPVVAGRLAQTPLACIPRPRLPSPEHSGSDDHRLVATFRRPWEYEPDARRRMDDS
jgi:hypothetical protein